MKSNSLLISILQRVWRRWFYLLTVVFLASVFSNFFIPDGKIGSFYIGPNWKDGSPLPVKLNINLPDTIIEYKTKNGGGCIATQYFSEKKRESILNKVDIISKDTLINKFIITQNYHKNHKVYIKNISEITEKKLQSTPLKVNLTSRSQSANASISTEAYFKSQSNLQNILFAIRSRLSTLLLILISYQILKILSHIKKNIGFNEELFKRVNWIGLLIICSEVVKLGLSIVYSRIYIHASLVSSSIIQSHNSLYISINPRLEFDFGYFFTGLLIIALSALVKKGINLQEDVDLTV